MNKQTVANTGSLGIGVVAVFFWNSFFPDMKMEAEVAVAFGTVVTIIAKWTAAKIDGAF